MNFAPRVTIPFLMINGRDDFNAPPAARERFIELLGTPAAQKQLVVLEGGHFPHDIRGLVRHTLDWFDQYFAPFVDGRTGDDSASGDLEGFPGRFPQPVDVHLRLASLRSTARWQS